MAAASDTPSRRITLPTLLLVIAGVVAAASIVTAVWRSKADSRAEDSPAARDWRIVGWAYAENGDAEASVAAYRKAAALEPDNAENWSSLAEALQTASTSVVPEAEAALQKALKIDPTDPRARYFLAVQKDLRGDHRGALAGWTALLSDTPADAPWRADLQRTIEQTASRHKIALGDLPAPQAGPVATAAIPGPTPEQLAAAASIPPAQQDQMARAMVERLAARLAANPGDADGWIRLIRSRTVLNDDPGAKQALRSALAAFTDDEPTQGRLRIAAAELGVTAGAAKPSSLNQ